MNHPTDISHAEFLMSLGVKHLNLPDPARTPHGCMVVYLALIERLNDRLGEDRVLDAILIGSIADRATDEWLRVVGHRYSKWIIKQRSAGKPSSVAALKKAAREEFAQSAH